MQLREETMGVAGVHMQALLVRHLLKETECNVELSPVRKDCTIRPIGNQLLRELGYTRVQVIEDHVNHGACFYSFTRDHIYGERLWIDPWTVVKHVDVSILV